MAADFELPVEASRVAELRRALGDADGRPDLAPPTFVVVADQFDPTFERRPRAGQPWPPPGGIEARLHVEQRIELARPVVAGELLSVRRLAPRTWQKEGRRGGLLDFIETTTELVAAGEVVVRSAWVDVRPERGHAAMSTGAAATPAEPPPDGAVAVTVAAPVTRTQLVMYVGVTGDFHPLHHDEEYATGLGYPSVFAPGMLTMALTGLAARTVVPEEHMAELSGRFRAQVWPGDTLVTYVAATADGCTATTRNQHGVSVFDGWAKRRGAPGSAA